MQRFPSSFTGKLLKRHWVLRSRENKTSKASGRDCSKCQQFHLEVESLQELGWTRKLVVGKDSRYHNNVTSDEVETGRRADLHEGGNLWVWHPRQTSLPGIKSSMKISSPLVSNFGDSYVLALSTFNIQFLLDHLKSVFFKIFFMRLSTGTLGYTLIILCFPNCI